VRGKQAERDEICVGTACLFSLRVIRPSLQAPNALVLRNLIEQPL